MAPFESLSKIRPWIMQESNFYRLHLVFFTVVPLIASGIFYVGNGEFIISYIDSLFLCYSALTDTGLSTVNLSACTGFQQAILFVLMVLGDATLVSWVVVLVRKRYFRQHCEAVVRDIRQRDRVGQIFRSTLKQVRQRYHTQAVDIRFQKSLEVEHELQSTIKHIRPGEAIGASPSYIQETLGSQHSSSNIAGINPHAALPTFDSCLSQEDHGILAVAHSITASPRSAAIVLQTTSVEPDTTGLRPYGRRRPRVGKRAVRQHTVMSPIVSDFDAADPVKRKDQNMGGFPGPLELFGRFARAQVPGVYKLIERWFSIPSKLDVKKSAKQRRWLSNDLEGLSIGRNSDINTELLSGEQLKVLCNVEYRSLRILSYIVIIYFLGVQLISFVCITPWLNSTSRYDSLFQNQFRLVPKTWFAAFQVVSAYTGTGMSLVDLGMVPFQRAWLMIFVLFFALLCGNHGVPIFLRFLIWICTKVVKEDSDTNKALHFLLDHPRRSFIYLFPSQVTWCLVAFLVIFTAIGWATLNVLNIGLPVIDELPVGAQVVAGLFQSFTIRASGFSIVPLASLSPAFQFLCIIMMMFSVYPISVSIRSTNVYEEESLGVFKKSQDDEGEEQTLDDKTSGYERIGKYVGLHLRRQVTLDTWWLAWGIFFTCIIERGKLMDPEKASWFNISRITFEMVSAFAGIGLTLGLPTDNFSFSGEFRVLSKLIVCIIMVRGRHHGLPVALDRAIMFPSELITNKPAVPSEASQNVNTEPQEQQLDDKIDYGSVQLSPA